MTKINEFVKNGLLNVVVKPNSPKTCVIGWDSNKQMLLVI